jgi:hypothetical protein
MNRLFVFSLLVLFLIPSIFALDFGYVVNNPSNLNSDDVLIKNLLIDNGHVVNFLDNVEFDAGDYDLIVISEGVSNIGGLFDNTRHKTLFLGNNAAKRAGLSSSFTTSSRRRSEIRGINNYITEEYSSGDIDLYTSTGSILYLNGCKATGSYSLVSHDSDSSKIVIFGVDQNSMLIDGGCTDRDKRIYESNVFFGLRDVSKWNNDAKNLFLRSVEWLISSGLVDGDGDGYNSLESGGDDCDDTDIEVNPGVSDINKNCVNDAPSINSVSPNSNFNILEDTDNVFSVSVVDEDSDLDYIWKVNNVIRSSSESYNLNENMGIYDVEVIVSDGSLSDSYIWPINVRDSSYFSCSDLNGMICTVSQICDGELYEVSDTNSCCSTSCSVKPLEFSDVSNTCEISDSRIEISLDNFDENIDYRLGQNIDFDIKIRNRFNEGFDFEIESYLYDVTNNKVIEKIKDEFDVNNGITELSSFVFELPYDLDEDNEYRIFVYAENDEWLCNQKDIGVDIDRDDVDIIIEDFKFDNNIVCGDLVDFVVDLKNYGDTDENVYVKISNSDLKIDEESAVFEIEKKDEDDEGRKKFSIQIPEDVGDGEYNIRAEVFTDGRNFILNKKINLGECNEVIVEGSSVDVNDIERLGSGSERVIGEVIKEVGVVEGLDKGEVFVGLVLLLIAMSSLGMVWWFFRG